MKTVNDYLSSVSDPISLMESFNKLPPLEKYVSRGIYPKLLALNDKMLDESTFYAHCDVLIYEATRTEGFPKEEVSRVLNVFIQEHLTHESNDVRYNDRSIEALDAEHQRLTSGPKKTDTKFSVLHHDGRTWHVTKHIKLNDAIKDYVKKSTSAKKTGMKVRIVDSKGTTIHSTN